MPHFGAVGELRDGSGVPGEGVLFRSQIRPRMRGDYDIPIVEGKHHPGHDQDDHNDEEIRSPRGFGFPNFAADSTDLSRGGLGLDVKVRGMQWSQFLAQDVLFILYEVTNTGTTTFPRVATGLTVKRAMHPVGGDRRRAQARLWTNGFVPDPGGYLPSVMRIGLQLSLPASPALLSETRRTLRGYMATLGVDREVVADIVMEPTFAADELERARTKLRSNLYNLADPATQGVVDRSLLDDGHEQFETRP